MIVSRVVPGNHICLTVDASSIGDGAVETTGDKISFTNDVVSKEEVFNLSTTTFYDTFFYFHLI